MSSDAAISAISDALRNPTVFNFDPLFRQNAVVALKNHELFSLLQIFANDDLLEFQAWMESHPGVVENYGTYVYTSIIHGIHRI
jgi:translation initiation factor 3 subunit M